MIHPSHTYRLFRLNSAPNNSWLHASTRRTFGRPPPRHIIVPCSQRTIPHTVYAPYYTANNTTPHNTVFTRTIYPRHRNIVPFRQRTISHTVFFPYHTANNTIPRTVFFSYTIPPTHPIPSFFHVSYQTVKYHPPTYPIYPTPRFFHVVYQTV